MTFLDKIKETAAFLKDKGIQAPEFGLILGSGLGELAEEIENPVVVDYSDIPNWGRSTVVGHAGKLVYGELSGRKVLALQGRFHFYEGNPLEEPRPCALKVHHIPISQRDRLLSNGPSLEYLHSLLQLDFRFLLPTLQVLIQGLNQTRELGFPCLSEKQLFLGSYLKMSLCVSFIIF